MRRTIKKTIAFCVAMVICLGILTPSVSGYSINEGEDTLHTLAKNEYTDAVEFGNGHLMLKDGKFNNITSKTKFFYVDDKGNTKEIKNTVGFTEVYLHTSGHNYFVDDGVLAVGKNGKIGIMDTDGKMFGGNESFYSCIIHDGGDLFYTTNATANNDDKTNTNQWTLRRKDGKVIKEFNNLFLGNRFNRNGYEYIMYEESGKNKLIQVNSAGVVKTITTDIDLYYVYEETGYIVTEKRGQDYKTSKMGLFNEDGRKMFELNECIDINLDRFDQYGYAKVKFAKETSEGTIYSENLIDRNGKMLLPEWKYDSIKSYDSDRILAIDRNRVGYLLDYSQNVKFNSKNFQYKYGEQYEALSHTYYYVNSTLTVSLTNHDNPNSEGKTFFLDKNANIKTENIKGYVSDFDGTNAMIYDSASQSFGIVDNKGNMLIKGYDDIRLEHNPSIDIIARGRKVRWQNTVLIKKDGKVKGDYQYVDWLFTNGHALVRDSSNKVGVVDKAGNEIVKCGEYDEIILDEQTESFIGYKGSQPFIFNKEGKPLNKANQYKTIGNYDTVFYRFRSSYGSDTYYNFINSKNIAITKDANDKFGLVQVRDSEWRMSDANNDGKIDILDLSTIGLVYGKSSGQTGWRDDLDINRDKLIDLFDLVMVSKKI